MTSKRGAYKKEGLIGKVAGALYIELLLNFTLPFCLRFAISAARISLPSVFCKIRFYQGVDGRQARRRRGNALLTITVIASDLT